MGSRLSGLGSAVYDSKRKEFLGRDGARWGKLGVFYFFFYLGSAGFFCAMLAVFMALTPRDHPYYTSHDSRMETRSNPLSPGLGFRPQPDVEKNLISVKKYGNDSKTELYAKSLSQYLQYYYGEGESEQRGSTNNRDRQGTAEKFTIRNPRDCTKRGKYGYESGRPCVLVKMNKIVDFVPEPYNDANKPDDFPKECTPRTESVPVACQGEFAADIDNVGPIKYYSENGREENCGSLAFNHFPYKGKKDRQDVYQAPYLWVQFQNPKPNVLISVICRAFAQNIDFDKKTGRGLTRFQIFVDGSNIRSSRNVGEI